jgi:hypothetical protein
LPEPFWRKDPLRAERTGLGLALSRALAERAGLELAFALDDGLLSAEIRGRDAARSSSAANGHAPLRSAGIRA